ncbi:hypothetical protein PSHT_15307 [Puccinia striiformis]|uniref:RSE1/DDB1/CPSF1 first beta-propeller domain-containing protein n=1 Tax=Puccinia striiformis TaxID=27350 RepID=A0A2S4UG21_9BASI|nr:hypothetical protein PSHT_15307 [Puccinia striiformis]
MRPDSSTVKLSSIINTNVFGTTHSLTLFRPTGATQDYIILGSDSGRVLVLKFNPSTNSLIKLHQETCGKSVAGGLYPVNSWPQILKESSHDCSNGEEQISVYLK